MKRLVFLLGVIVLLWGGPVASAQGEEPPRVYYEVKAGDSLAAISERFGISIEAIAAANNLADANLIYAGQQLLIPGQAPAQSPETAFAAAEYRAATYRLRPGDTLTALARRFAVEPAQILQANGLARPDRLWDEPEIRIPLPVPADLPVPFLAVRHSPAIIQGKTGVVDVYLTEPESLQGWYGDQPLTFFYQGDGYPGHRYTALIPTPALLAPADRVLRVLADGVEVQRSLPTLAGSYETQQIVLPPGKGDLLDPPKVRDELAELRAHWGVNSPEALWGGRFRFPIGDGYVQTSPYGTRRSYNGGPVASFHDGTDWSAAEGTPILAPAAGVVVLAEDLIVRGGAVVVDHGQGVFSNFWHLSRIDVEPGQHVERGEQLGLVGTTGLSTGAHLHWEIRINGVAVDPLQWSRVFFPYEPLVAAN